jgi:hypothetical protein
MAEGQRMTAATPLKPVRPEKVDRREESHPAAVHSQADESDDTDRRGSGSH